MWSFRGVGIAAKLKKIILLIFLILRYLRTFYFYRVIHLVTNTVDIQFIVQTHYKLLILKRNCYCNVNERLSSTRWTAMYLVQELVSLENM